MRNVILVLSLLCAALAAACGAPDKRAECGGPGQCPRGQYCATEGVCWPDAAPPTVTSFSATCAGPCVRDGVVRVAVTATDESRMGTVRARLDLAPAIAVTLPRSGAGWAGDVALSGYPFPAFERPVSVTVEVTDEAGNAAEGPLPAVVQVSRLKWVFEGVGTGSGVAVYPDGSALVTSGATDKLLRIGPDGQKVWGLSPGANDLGVPSIGTGVAWVGNSAGTVFAVSDAGVVVNGAGCATGGAVMVPPAVDAAGSTSFAPSQSKKLFAVPASDATTCRETQVTQAYDAAAVIREDAAIVAASNGLRALLRSFNFATEGFSENWALPPDIGLSLTAAPAVDAQSRVWTVSADGNLNATTSAGTTSTVKQLGAGAGGPVVLSDGSAVLGDNSGVLQRIALAGTTPWSTPPNLGATPQTPLVLTGGDAELVVPTAQGKLFALRAADGSEVWSTQLVAGSGALRPGNIHTPAGSSLSLGYFPAANGRLYAVVLDGRLDAAAPWPKAFHDPRNTGNAATPIP